MSYFLDSRSLKSLSSYENKTKSILSTLLLFLEFKTLVMLLMCDDFFFPQVVLWFCLVSSSQKLPKKNTSAQRTWKNQRRETRVNFNHWVLSMIKIKFNNYGVILISSTSLRIWKESERKDRILVAHNFHEAEQFSTNIFIISS